MGRMLSLGPDRALPQNLGRIPRTGINDRFSGVSGPAQIRALPDTPVLEQVNPMRRMAFYAAVAMIFVRMSVTPEIIAYYTGTNTYILYLIGPPALIGVLITGGFGRAFRAKVAWFWTCLVIWMFLSTPFSSWQGGSAGVVSAYARTSYICLIVLAGTVAAWKDLKSVFNMMAASSLAVLLVARFLAKPDAEGRLALDVTDSTIGNPNDLAAHVLLLLPFIVYFGFKSGQNKILRVFTLVGGLYSIWVILETSSRGALVGLAAMALFLFLKASGAQRIAIVVAVPILAAVSIAVIPAQNLMRLETIFTSSPTSAEAAGIAAEAGESRESRTYLLKKSIQFTFEHPVFGVGPGQFSNFEGSTSRKAGEHGNWHETHNTYTQISSECGIPALILMLASMIGALGLVNKTLKKARARGNQEIAGACLCYLVSWVGYLVTIFFLACAYRFTLPTMVGLAIAIHLAGERELDGPGTAPGRTLYSVGSRPPALHAAR
jgi:O-antigen ligase